MSQEGAFEHARLPRYVPRKFVVSIFITYNLNLHYWDLAWEGSVGEFYDERVTLVMNPPRYPTATRTPWGDITADSSTFGRPFDGHRVTNKSFAAHA